MSKLVLLHQGAERLVYYPNFFKQNFFAQLQEELNWRQNEIVVFGKKYLEPRLTAWYGLPYQYSSIKWPQQDFIPVLSQIKEGVEAELSFSFNSVLANYYRDGNDAMGWHRDNEKEMDQRIIASVTFGGERVFKVKSRISDQLVEVKLLSGSLLVMENLQTNWMHALPRTKRINAPRINLTFRNIILPQ